MSGQNNKASGDGQLLLGEKGMFVYYRPIYYRVSPRCRNDERKTVILLSKTPMWSLSYEKVI